MPPWGLTLVGCGYGTPNPGPTLALLDNFRLAGLVGGGPGLGISESENVRAGGRVLGWAGVYGTPEKGNWVVEFYGG